MTVHRADQQHRPFADFVNEVEPRLRRALVSRYGFDAGREATAHALAWAWEHWGDVDDMVNAAGYLYRVGCSNARPRRGRALFDASPHVIPEVEPALAPALARLSEHQRVAVVLTLAFDWTLAEVAELTGSSVSSVNTHRRRGLAKLRKSLGVELT